MTRQRSTNPPGAAHARFTLDGVVPWGRSFEEYARMFGVETGDLASVILGCGDGPASFNAEASSRGVRVISCDPLYQFDGGQVLERIAETTERVLDETRRHADQFVWTAIPSVEALATVRRSAMARFLDDYRAGARQGRYVAGALPLLPFADATFDLALCSHLLFLYGEHLGAAFHEAAVMELARVAREVRVFPLLALDGTPSPLVDPCRARLERLGRTVTIERVDYEFQRGGNQMMRVR